MSRASNRKPNAVSLRPSITYRGNAPSFGDAHVEAVSNKAAMFREYVQEFVANYRILFDESKLPGLRFVLGFHCPVRRTAWFVLYAILFVLTMHDTNELLLEYGSHGDALNQYVEMKQHVQFPAVTACNMNPWRLTQLCSDPSFAVGRASRWTSKLCSATRKAVPGDVKELKKLSDWISAEQRRNFTRASRMGHQLKDMIKECWYGDQDCLDENLLELRMIPRHGNCYCLGCNVSLFNWTTKPMLHPKDGLRMTLNSETDEYLPLVADAGFYIMVHQPGVQEETVTNALFLPPGHTTYIGVSVSVLHRLKPPYKNPCQDTWPPEFQKYVVPGMIYTRRACLEYCYQVHVFEACGCRSYNHIRIFLPEVANSPLCCDILQEDCEREIEEKVDRENITCQCLSACETKYYQTTASTLSWTRNTVPRQEGEKEEGKTTHTEIVVFMQSTKILHQEQQPKVTLVDVFRRIGGLMGAYLGYTVLHVFHVLDVIVVGLSLVAKRIQRQRSRKQQR